MTAPKPIDGRRAFNEQLASTMFRYARRIRLACGDLIQAERLEERARQLSPAEQLDPAPPSTLP